MAIDSNRLSLREGKIYLDGEQIMENVTLEINFTPEVAESRSVGQRGKSRRWLGHDITGNMTEYKSTPWLKDAVKKYMNDGSTPKFTCVGVQNDANADYNMTYGNDVITVENMVITGDINLIELDAEGEHVISDIEFGASNVIIS